MSSAPTDIQDILSLGPDQSDITYSNDINVSPPIELPPKPIKSDHPRSDPSLGDLEANHVKGYDSTSIQHSRSNLHQAINPFADLFGTASSTTTPPPQSPPQQTHDPFSEEQELVPTSPSKPARKNTLSTKQSLNLILRGHPQRKDDKGRVSDSHPPQNGVLQWMKMNGFSSDHCEQLAHLDGPHFITMEKAECMERLGTTSGILLFTRLRKIRELFLDQPLDLDSFSIPLYNAPSQTIPSHTHIAHGDAQMLAPQDRVSPHHNDYDDISPQTHHQQNSSLQHQWADRQDAAPQYSTYQTAQLSRPQQPSQTHIASRTGQENTHPIQLNLDDYDDHHHTNHDEIDDDMFGSYHSSSYQHNGDDINRHGTSQDGFFHELFSNIPMPFEWNSQSQHHSPHSSSYDDQGTILTNTVATATSFLSTFYSEFMKLCEDYQLSSQEISQYKKDLARRLEMRQRVHLQAQRDSHTDPTSLREGTSLSSHTSHHRTDESDYSSINVQPSTGTGSTNYASLSSQPRETPSRTRRDYHTGYNSADAMCEYGPCQNRCNSSQCSIETCRIRLCLKHVEKDLFTGYLYCQPCYQNTYSYSVTNNIVMDSICGIQ